MTREMSHLARAAIGYVADGYEKVFDQLNAYFLADPEFSAQLAIYVGDDLVVDVAGGNLTADALTGVFSISKGAAAVALGTLIDDGVLDIDNPVASYWPEFAAADKGAVTVRQLLSHQAGLLGTPSGFSVSEVLDSSLGAAKLAAMRTAWVPGSSFGYHGITIGILIEELVRRIAGISLQDLYESKIRSQRNLDFFLGIPSAEDARYQKILPARLPSENVAQAQISGTNDGLASLMLNSMLETFDPAGGPLSPNDPVIRAAGPAALGGVASARGIAALYANTIGISGEPILSHRTIELMSQQQVWGTDRVFNGENCFGIIFMKPQPRMDFGSYQAFGHDGIGGALGYADPLYRIAFGYVPNPMQFPGGADERAIALSRVVRACALRTSGHARSR